MGQMQFADVREQANGEYVPIEPCTLQSPDSSRWPPSNCYANFGIARCVQRAAKHSPSSPTWNGWANRDDISATKSIAVARMCPMCHSGAAIGLTSSAIMVAAAAEAPNYCCHVDLEQQKHTPSAFLVRALPHTFSSHLKHSTDFRRLASIR